MARAAWSNPATMASQASGVFSVGAPPPPLSTEPIASRVTSAGVRLFFSIWVICPIFSSSVI